MIKICENCSKSYECKRNTHAIQRFCSSKCNRLFRTSGETLYPHISPSAVGTIAELIVANDFLGKGYEVYRSVTLSSKSDLIVSKDKELTTVEVRNGFRSRDGKITTNRAKNRSQILAIVILRSEEIIYEKSKKP